MFFLQTTKLDITFVKNIDFLKSVPEDFLKELLYLEKYVEQNPKCQDDIREFVKKQEETVLVTVPKTKIFRFEKAQRYWPTNAHKIVMLRNDGLWEVKFLKTTEKQNSAEIAARQDKENSKKDKNGKKVNSALIAYNPDTQSAWLEEFKPDTDYDGQFPMKEFPSRFKWPHNYLKHGLNNRVITDGITNNHHTLAALYCSDYEDAVNLKNQIVLGYKPKDRLKQYGGLINVGIKYFKQEVCTLFYREICRFLYNQKEVDNLYCGNPDHVYGQKPHDEHEHHNSESEDEIFSAKSKKSKKHHHQQKHQDKEVDVTFEYNEDVQVLLRYIDESDMMKFCFNGYKLQKGILPVMTVRGGFATGDFAENIIAFVVDITLVYNKDKRILWTTSFPIVYKNKDEGLHISHFTTPESYNHETIWNFNKLWLMLKSYSENVDLKFSIKFMDEKDDDNDFSSLGSAKSEDEQKNNEWSINFWELHRSILEHKVMIIPFFEKNVFLWVDFLRVSILDNTFDLENLMQSQRIIFDSFYWDRYKFPCMSPHLYNLIISQTLPPFIEKAGQSSTYDECVDLLKAPQKYTSEICKFISEQLTIKSAYNAVYREIISNGDYEKLVDELEISKHFNKILGTNSHFKDLTTTFWKKDIDHDKFASLLQLCCIGMKRNQRFSYWRSLIEKSNKNKILSMLEPIVQKQYEQIQSLDTMNEDSLFQVHDLKVDCFIRSTKALSFLGNNLLADQHTLNLMKKEIQLIIGSVTDNLNNNTDMLYDICWAIMLTNQFMHPKTMQLKKDKDGKIPSTGLRSIEKCQKEIFILKLVLANLNSDMLMHIFGMGLSQEKLVMIHQQNNFVDQLNSEGSLNIRDIFFVMNFFTDHDDDDGNTVSVDYLFMLYKSCFVSSILDHWEEMFFKINNACDFEIQFIIYFKQHIDYQKVLPDAFKKLSQLLKGESYGEMIEFFHDYKIKGLHSVSNLIQYLEQKLIVIDSNCIKINSKEMKQFLDFTKSYMAKRQIEKKNNLKEEHKHNIFQNQKEATKHNDFQDPMKEEMKKMQDSHRSHVSISDANSYKLGIEVNEFEDAYTKNVHKKDMMKSHLGPVQDSLDSKNQNSIESLSEKSSDKNLHNNNHTNEKNIHNNSHTHDKNSNFHDNFNSHKPLSKIRSQMGSEHHTVFENKLHASNVHHDDKLSFNSSEKFNSELEMIANNDHNADNESYAGEFSDISWGVPDNEIYDVPEQSQKYVTNTHNLAAINEVFSNISEKNTVRSSVQSNLPENSHLQKEKIFKKIEKEIMVPLVYTGPYACEETEIYVSINRHNIPLSEVGLLEMFVKGEVFFKATIDMYGRISKRIIRKVLSDDVEVVMQKYTPDYDNSHLAFTVENKSNHNNKIKTFKGNIDLRRFKFDTFERLRILLKKADASNNLAVSRINIEKTEDPVELDLHDMLFFDLTVLIRCQHKTADLNYLDFKYELDESEVLLHIGNFCFIKNQKTFGI